MITITPYFRNPTTGEEKLHQPEHVHAAVDLLAKVNRMLLSLGWDFPIDPDTGSPISGKKGGSGDGGFRAPDTATGVSRSMHRSAHAVDVYDPEDKLDGLITDELMEEYGLYREHPNATPGWVHLQDLPPRSKRRTYHP